MLYALGFIPSFISVHSIKGDRIESTCVISYAVTPVKLPVSSPEIFEESYYGDYFSSCLTVDSIGNYTNFIFAKLFKHIILLT